MGRAFPELQHETFHIYGVSGTPMAITNDHHDQTIIDTHDNVMMEWLARGVTIRMGGVAYIAEYPMDGATAKRASDHRHDRRRPEDRPRACATPASITAIPSST